MNEIFGHSDEETEKKVDDSNEKQSSENVEGEVSDKLDKEDDFVPGIFFLLHIQLLPINPFVFTKHLHTQITIFSMFFSDFAKKKKKSKSKKRKRDIEEDDDEESSKKKRKSKKKKTKKNKENPETEQNKPEGDGNQEGEKIEAKNKTRGSNSFTR